MQKVKNSQDIIKVMVLDKDNDENEDRDFLIRENANNIYSIALVSKQIHQHEHAKYLFENIISEKATELHKDGTIYLHDKGLMPYCVSLDVKQIASDGIPTIAKNMNASKPSKSFFKFIRHISNAVTFLSNQVSGAIMLANFSTIIGSYIKYHEENGVKQEITTEELYREIGSLIWELNVPLRNGSESPFTNITMEFDKCSPVIKDDSINIGGEFITDENDVEITYSDLDSKYINMVNDAVIYFMGKGPGNGKIFTFPLITVQMGDDFDKNNKTYKYLIDESAKFGGFYVENFRTRAFLDSDYKNVNPLIKPKDPSLSKSMCCMEDDTAITVFDITGKAISTTMSELHNTYATEDIDVNPQTELFIESLNPDTFKIEKVKISGFLKKKTHNRIYSITTSSLKQLYVTGDHPLIIKDSHNDKIYEIETSLAFKMIIESEPNRYLIPVI